MKQHKGLVAWPKDAQGTSVPTVHDVITGLDLCESCWNSEHSRVSSNGVVNKSKCSRRGCECSCTYTPKAKVKREKIVTPTFSEVYGEITIK